MPAVEFYENALSTNEKNVNMEFFSLTCFSIVLLSLLQIYQE